MKSITVIILLSLLVILLAPSSVLAYAGKCSQPGFCGKLTAQCTTNQCVGKDVKCDLKSCKKDSDCKVCGCSKICQKADCCVK